MSKLKITFDNTHYINLKNSVMFGTIPQDILIDRFKDGRVFGLLVEDLVVEHFSNIIKMGNINKGYDIIVEEIGKIEIKSFTKNGCDITPSYMKGAGRYFNREEYNKFLNNVQGICICDNIDFPDVYVVLKKPDYFITESSSGKLTPNKRDKLFEF